MAPHGAPMLDSAGNPVTEMPTVSMIGTAAVVFDDKGAVLLERRSDNGLWGLPGGALDVGESVADGLVREVFEETQLHVTIKRLVGIYSDPARHSIATYPDGQRVHFVIIVLECEIESGELRISEESTDIGYFRPGQLPENTMAASRMIIADALSGIAEPFIR